MMSQRFVGAQGDQFRGSLPPPAKFGSKSSHVPLDPSRAQPCRRPPDQDGSFDQKMRLAEASP
jgi:hypothetical protein